MKLILKKGHHNLYVISVAFFYFLFYPLLYFFSRNQAHYPYMNKLRRVWVYLSSSFAGIFYKFTYEAPFDRKKAYIICPNHTSNLDISAMCLLEKAIIVLWGKMS